MNASEKRPPADRGQGRKSVQGVGKSPVLQVVVTPEQKAKAMRLGGAKWVRQVIDKAREVSHGDK
jgi:hypothetical protein